MTEKSFRTGRPLVSIVMSVYNGLPYMTAALESLVGQTYTNLEFVIVDDGSTDGSREVLRAYAVRDERFRLIEQPNAGLTKALIRGVSESRGTYVARMDADDISVPHRIERQVEALEADPSAVGAFGRYERITADGAVVRISPPILFPHLLPWYQTFRNLIGHGPMMFRRQAYERAGGYDAEFRFGQDYDLWSRLIKLGRIIVLDEVLYKFRIGHASISTQYSSDQQNYGTIVNQRVYHELTGHKIDALWARKLRHFWGGNDKIPFEAKDAVQLNRFLVTAFRAYSASVGAERDCRVQLQTTVARQWIRWASRSAHSTDVVASLKYLLLALRWQPWLPFEIASTRVQRFRTRRQMD
ncbi:glycosyltransferase [Sphingosinicella sp. CPCC 101087]|uniref:glycosyltransferase family 2 protein n=1 Tax=Sphingosinicella sp. CPCC 101087 TaxID=2497754 RepID=UPI00101CC751|nr:glycosyltransferase [Sphingosinicella sp. CPCC 101087]